MQRHAHAGWRSRGYLPHCDGAGLVQHIVFGLADAVAEDPAAGVYDAAERAALWHAAFDRLEGEAVLRGEAATIIDDALLHFDGERYALLAWCVMPNHVHVVLEQFPGVRLDRVVHAWKSFTAHAINASLGRRGRLWRREYFDRYMRDDAHLAATVRYVEMNPVSCGLCAAAEEWRWSSAWSGRR